ncbi:MAG: hypothetical protein IJI14_16155 [Anaerolineaceae bacterium]|nr:hypothetical protein [Anaerolineaceae bacterium]
MSALEFTKQQKKVISAGFTKRIWLTGQAGTGKTTAAIERVKRILKKNGEKRSVLVIAPTFNHMKPYLDIVSDDGVSPVVATFNSCVQKWLRHFWVLVAEKAGFDMKRKPLFLDIEAAQIIMAKLTKRKIDEGYFGGLQMSPSRVFNQILIAMHKCASAEIPFSDYKNIMSESCGEEESIATAFEQAQECGEMFREYCIKHNLLDYSLQVEVFMKYLLPDPIFVKWIKKQNIHLIFENAEEDVPAAHRFVREMSPNFKSILIVCDRGGGYRSFMGCDVVSAANLEEIADVKINFKESFVSTPDIRSFGQLLEDYKTPDAILCGNPRNGFLHEPSDLYLKMIEKAAGDVFSMIKNGNAKPQDFVILTPFMTEAFSHEMQRALKERGIDTYMRHVKKPLLTGKISRSLLTLCQLVKPYPGVTVRKSDVVRMLECFIKDTDPVRANIAFNCTFKRNQTVDNSSPCYSIMSKEEIKTQKKTVLGCVHENTLNSIDLLREWVDEIQKEDDTTPDVIVYRFFNDLLISDGFKSDEETGKELCRVLESMRKFRFVTEHFRSEEDVSEAPDWEDYFRLVGLEMISAYSYEENMVQPENTVLISSVSSYLSVNCSHKYQLWMNIGSPYWRSSFFGYLTNDAILSRNWIPGEKWNGVLAEKYNDSNMRKHLLGLLSRCGQKAFLYSSRIDEAGRALKGELLYLVSAAERRLLFGDAFQEVQYSRDNNDRGETISHAGNKK